MLQHHDRSDKKTSLVFAAAVEKEEKYELILASMACELLESSEVKCTSQNVTPKGFKNDETKGLPMWKIGTAIGGPLLLLLLIIIIIVIVIVRKRRTKQVVL